MMFGVAYVVSSTPRFEVEAVDRLDQPDRADLDEIVELLAAVRVAPRERANERHVLLDQLLARRQVALLVVAAQQDLVGLVHATPPFARSTRLVSSIHCAPSRSSIATPSQTAERIRPRLRPSLPPFSSSARNGGERSDGRPELVAGDQHPHRHLSARGGTLEHCIEGKLEIFEVFEGEVEPHGEAAQHEMGDAVEGVVRGQRQADLVSAQCLPPVRPLG